MRGKSRWFSASVIYLAEPLEIVHAEGLAAVADMYPQQSRNPFDIESE
jgi:hypothetical protein